MKVRFMTNQGLFTEYQIDLRKWMDFYVFVHTATSWFSEEWQLLRQTNCGMCFDIEN